MNENYKKAGVDVEAGYEAVKLIQKHTEKTFTKGVLSGIGGFGGLFELDVTKYKNPVLVSGTDGVGTKLKIAFIMDKHDTIGQDCVAMCANDVVCCGAEPLYFLDYLAVGKNVPTRVEEIVRGVADGCELAGCALIGGETAEMPGFYPEDEYDLAGFCVGAVDKGKIFEGAKKGDALVGIKSSGVHSNGFSLVRKIFGLNSPSAREKLSEYFEDLGKTLGEELLTPTAIYVKKILEMKNVHAVSHITGGGFIENIPRIMPKGLEAKIDKNSFEVPPIFKILASYGAIPENEMFNTFNMGIGMVVATSNPGPDDMIIGEVVEGDEGVVIV